MAKKTLVELVIKMALDASKVADDAAKVQQRMEKLGNTVADVGDKLTAGVSLPLIGAGTAALVFSNKFNAGMANVASLSKEAAASVAGWGPQIQRMAIDTGQATGVMTEGMYQVVSAFGVAGDSLDVLKINARAATAGAAETADAINLTSAVTKAYGDTSAGAVQQVADLALKTVQLGQTTFPELASSIGRVTPLTAALTVSQEELFAVMATGTGVTGSAAEVSTQLRGILQSLLAPTDAMTGLMDEYGFASGQAMIQSLGLQGTIDAIVQAAEASGRPLQEFIGSIEGQTLAMVLAGEQSATFSEKLEAMGDATGAVDEAFRAQTEGVNEVGFAMQQAAIQAQVWAERLGNALGPALLDVMQAAEPLVDSIEQAITAFAEMDAENQKLILGALGVVVALGPVVTIIGKVIAVGSAISSLVTSISAAATAAGSLGAAFGAVWAAALPFVNIAAGIAIVGTAAVKTYQFIKMLKEGFEGIDNALVEHENQMRNTADSYDAYITEMVRAEGVSRDWNESFQQGVIDMLMAAENADQFNSVLNQLGIETEIATEETFNLAQETARLREQWAGAVGDDDPSYHFANVAAAASDAATAVAEVVDYSAALKERFKQMTAFDDVSESIIALGDAMRSANTDDMSPTQLAAWNEELVALQENAAAAVEGAMIASIMGQLEALADMGDMEGFNQLLGLLKQVSPEQAKIVETNLALSDTFNAIMSAAMDSGVGIGVAKKVYEEFVAAVDSGINPIIASAEAIRKIEEAANAAAGDYTVSFRVVTEGDYPSAPAQGSTYAYAHGGTIDPTSDFILVGEHGPELMMNPGGGSVVNNSDLMSLLGGGRGDTYINTTNYIDSRLEFERMIAENTERIKEAQPL